MVKYSCERCGKEFSQKSHYDSHNRRKMPCENNTEKNKGNVYKVIEEKLNNKKLLVENEEVNVNTYIMKQQSQTKKNEINNKLKFIDLCCGIGGFHYALKNLGYECVMASDINEHCRLNYEENHKIKPLGDLTKIDVETIPRFDILCAGFPCFVAGTKVLTHNGYKNIEDVVLIDTLMSHTGKFQKILNLQHKIYNGILYNIKAKYHPSFKCTDEHPFYVREKTQKWNNKLRKYEYTFKIPEWKKAYELDNNHYFGMKINQNSIIPEFNFDKKINKHKVNTINIKLDVLDMWFMMGYFIGDGWIEETNKPNECSMNKIRFAINTKDENDILPRINNILQITDKNCPTGNNCNKYGCSDFVWFNIFKQFGKYAHGKLIPEWVQDAPTEYIQEFVNGYHIADGCITKNDCYEFTTVSYNLAFGLQRLYLKLGHLFGINKYIPPKTTIIEERTVKQRDIYHIRGYIKERKKNHSSFIENGYVWYAPSKIEKVNVENEPVYNFEVENDNSYVIENIISHNCQPFSKAGERKGFQDERGNIFFDICKIIKYHNPKYIILENVRNLASHDGGNTWDVIRESIEELNYNTYEYPVILNTLYFGVPQSRERVVIMCKRKDLGDLPKLPPISKNNIKSTTLEEIVDDNVHEKYNISGKLKVTEKVWSNFLDICALNNIMIPRFPIWTDWWDSDGDNTKMTKYNKKLSEEENKAKNKKEQEDFYKKYKNWIDKNREFYNENIGVLKPWLTESRNNALWVGAVRKMEWQTGTDNLKMNQVLWSPRGSGVRIKNINYSPTLVAMASMIPIYGPKSRYLTPRECAKLQSFPEEYILHKEDKVSYSQFGNAVNVKMIERCTRFLIHGESLFE